MYRKALLSLSNKNVWANVWHHNTCNVILFQRAQYFVIKKYFMIPIMEGEHIAFHPPSPAHLILSVLLIKIVYCLFSPLVAAHPPPPTHSKCPTIIQEIVFFPSGTNSFAGLPLHVNLPVTHPRIQCVSQRFKAPIRIWAGQSIWRSHSSY